MRTDRWQTVLSLARLFALEPVDRIDWDEAIAISNRTLTLTALAAAISKLPDSDFVPGEVKSYLGEILARNTQRNRMLEAQLGEAAACLNRHGIRPLVTKGAAILVSAPDYARSGRMLIDLDLMVRPHEMFQGIEALKTMGYKVRTGEVANSWPGNPNYHRATVLARPQDAGSIDLQCRPKGPGAFANIDWLYEESTPLELAGGTIIVPSARSQIQALILHDQFQDGDYWRGLLDLRHFCDFHALLQAVDIGGLDRLLSGFSDGYERHAVDTQLGTFSMLFPGAMEHAPKTARARFQCKRRQLQIRQPVLRPAFTLLSLLSELPSFSSWDRFGGEAHGANRRTISHYAQEFRRIFRPKALGKI